MPYTTTGINTTGATVVTIHDGAIVVDSLVHLLSTENQELVDELTTIERGDLTEDRLTLQLESDRVTVVIKHAEGNITHPDKRDLELDSPDEQIILDFNGLHWEIVPIEQEFKPHIADGGTPNTSKMSTVDGGKVTSTGATTLDGGLVSTRF